MARPFKLSPIEIARIRAALPYLKGRVTVPSGLIAAVGGGPSAVKPIKIGARDVKKLALALTSGPVVVSVWGKRLSIKIKRGPGRPFPGASGSANAGRGSKPVSRSVSKGRQLQGRYMGTLRGLTVGQQVQVKKAKADHGYTAAFQLAKQFKKA